jgi:hypothetical protein
VIVKIVAGDIFGPGGRGSWDAIVGRIQELGETVLLDPTLMAAETN